MLDWGTSIPQYISVRGLSLFGPYQWVDNGFEASWHVAFLVADPYVGVTVECVHSNVCVVQLSSARHCVLLDAIALGDIMHALLQPLMMHENIQKVFHGHEDEVTMLSNEFSIMVPHAQIFDTRTYAGDRLGLTDLDLKEVCAALLHYDLGISDKSPDRHQRPLSAELLHEAAIHVQMLLCLQDACEAWAPWAQATAIG